MVVTSVRKNIEVKSTTCAVKYLKDIAVFCSIQYTAVVFHKIVHIDQVIAFPINIQTKVVRMKLHIFNPQIFFICSSRFSFFKE